MAAFDDATPRQQEILTQLSRRMGFNVSDVTNVIYSSDVPVEVSYANASGTFTRDVRQDLGGIINDLEETAFRLARTAGLQESLDGISSLGAQTPGNRAATELFDFTQRAANTAETIRENVSGFISNVSGNRLTASGLISGAVVTASSSTPEISRFPSSSRDLRVKISDPSGRISRLGGALQPLSRTDYKIVFPYTPEITLTHSSNYTDRNPTHSNYEYLFYQNSTISEINISANFTANKPADADYILAVQHFFRSATKMFYGKDDIAGLPPIVCRLEGHGDLQFSYVPVVITNFNITLPSDVDYISATDPNQGRVPTMQTMAISAKPLYSRSRITNEFSLTEFAQGSLLGSPDRGTGGFI